LLQRKVTEVTFRYDAFDSDFADDEALPSDFSAAAFEL